VCRTLLLPLLLDTVDRLEDLFAMLFPRLQRLLERREQPLRLAGIFAALVHFLDQLDLPQHARPALAHILFGFGEVLSFGGQIEHCSSKPELKPFQGVCLRIICRVDMGNRDIIVIGGSSGATAPLKAILGAFPPDLPAAVCVVMHIPTRSIGILKSVAAAAGQLPVHAAEDGMRIEPGNVYLGVPDQHFILQGGRIKLGRGPRENMSRPAIDPLFRSAAVSYGPRVIGVVLSGLLNDGASGLEAVKRCGGMALVQDPADAAANEMPRSALRAVEADLSVPAARLGDVLADLARDAPGPRVPIPPELRIEVDIAAGERADTRRCAASPIRPR